MKHYILLIYLLLCSTLTAQIFDDGLLDNGDFESVVVTSPGEHRLLNSFQQWESTLGVPVHICEDNRFLATPQEFSDWAEGKKQLRMAI